MGKTSRELEEALRESQANLSALIENIDGTIWSVDRNYRLLAGNSAFHQDIEATRGRPFAPGDSVLSEEFEAVEGEWRGYYDRALRGEQFSVEAPRAILRATHTMEYRFHPIRAAGGSVVGVTVLGHDITERKQAESRRKADLEALARTHTLLDLPLEPAGFQPILQEYMEAAVAFVSADRGTLQLLEGDSLRIVAHSGHQAPFLDFFAAAEQCASACGEALRRGERVVIPDVETSPLFVGTPSLAVLRQAGVRAVLSAPMMSRTGRLHGILTTHWAAPHTPDEHDLWQMDMLARQVANLVEVVQSEEENRKLLAAVQQEKDHLSALLNSIRDEVWFADTDKTFTLLNPAVVREFRMSPEGAGIEQVTASLEIYRPDGTPRPVDEAPMLRALRGQAVTRLEEMIRTPATGELRWREVNATPVRDPDGAIIGAVAVVRDITERKQAEEALRESEAKYRLIVENAKEGIWTVDANRQTLYVNEQMATMLGYSVQEMMELPWTAFVREAVEQEGSDRRVQERKQGVQRSSEQYDLRLTCKDGSTRWVIVHSAPRFDAQGRYIGSTSMLTDITERKQVEGELFTLNQRLAALLKALPVGASYSTDLACQHIEGNPALWAQFEIAPVDNISASASDPTAVGRRVSYFHQGRELADSELPLQRAVAEGREVPPVELEILLPSGRRWYGMCSGAPVRGQDGSIIGGTAVTVDITERKQAEQERERLLVQTRQDAETKAELLKEVNHRVKNNLAAIVGLLYAHLDHTNKSTSPEYRALVRELTHRIEGLSIVHGLLSRSLWAPVRLDELAEKIVGAALQSESRSNVAVSIAPSSLLISPNQAQTIAMVLNELALNVAKHTGPGTGVRVTVGAVQDQNLITLTVRDNGPGYPEPVITGQQVGIGLELLRNLIRQNLRGQMVLRNEGGAVAEIRFPVAEMAPAGEREVCG